MVAVEEQAGGLLARAVAEIASGPSAPPGVCLAVSHGGTVTWSAQGVAQAFDDDGPLAKKPAMTIDTASDLGCVSKILGTTTALMRLVDAGEVRITSRLAEVMPWTSSFPVGAATMTQLLEHRSGLWEWWPLYLAADEPQAALRQIAKLPLRYAPDADRHYSDLGFQLLGGVLTELTGNDLEATVTELVLEPLGLAATQYRRPVAGLTAAASSTGDHIETDMIRTGIPYPVLGDADEFRRWRTHVLVGEVNDCNSYHAFGSVAGHAGLFSTARDLLRFGDVLLQSLRGDGFLRIATLRRFLTPSPAPRQALCFCKWSSPSGDAWGHIGFPGVMMGIFPDLDASVAMVTNRLHVEGRRREIEPMWTTAVAAAGAFARRA